MHGNIISFMLKLICLTEVRVDGDLIVHTENVG